MNRRVLLPRLLTARLLGFAPIFDEPLELVFPSTGAFVILGGNGLGKTTIMQAIAYGLCGGPEDEAVEPAKAHRWDCRYFRGRLHDERGSPSTIEIGVAFGEHHVEIVRGIRASSVQRIQVDSESWVSGPDASIRYERFLTHVAGYRQPADFAFLVHRLLYLPESRRLLAWDADAQTRLVMLLSPDLVDEQEFRLRRARLKQLDSKKRHTHVDIGKLRKVVGRLEVVKQPGEEKLQPADRATSGAHAPTLKLEELLGRLAEVRRSREAADRRLLQTREELSRRASEVEELRRELESREAVLIQRALDESVGAETRLDLPIAALCEHGVCPACGTQARALQALALERQREHQCVLCGAEELAAVDDLDTATLRSQLSQKRRAELRLARRSRAEQGAREALRHRELVLDGSVAEIRANDSLSSSALVLRRLESEQEPSIGVARSTLAELIKREAELETQIAGERDHLEGEYARFRDSVAADIDRLRSLYGSYATRFLGVECELHELEGTQRLFRLPTLVPFFEGAERPAPEACSEAQRFFLDIALRMSLIEWASHPTVPSMFLCETPENALDLSYIDNVADMFESFANANHLAVVTANIQREGLAHRLLKKVPASDRAQRHLNLLRHGRLSDVHKRQIDVLQAEVEDMLR